MATHTTWLSAVGVLAMVFGTATSNRARAGELERIRPESSLLKTVMTTAVDRSATFRSLVDRIEQSDVIVYLTCERFGTTTLRARTLLASAGGHARYLRIQILCQQPVQAIVTVVAHELQHVVEIASTASVVDGRSFRRLFSAIGFATCVSPYPEQFETTAALKTGDRVYSEFVHHSDIGSPASHAPWRADRAARKQPEAGPLQTPRDGE